MAIAICRTVDPVEEGRAAVEFHAARGIHQRSLTVAGTRHLGRCFFGKRCHERPIEERELRRLEQRVEDLGYDEPWQRSLGRGTISV